MNKRNVTVGLAALLTAVGVWLALFGLPGGRLDYAAFAHHYDYNGDTNPDFHVSIDKIADGATFCDPVNDASIEAVGTDHQVAACIEDSPGLIGAFAVTFTYDPTLDSCTDVADSGTALDDNPDANTGATVWGAVPTGDNLGPFGAAGQWDCSGFGFASPTCDKDGNPATGDAYIGCLDAAGPFTLGDNEDNGVLAVLTLHVDDVGTDTVDLKSVVVGDDTGTEIGSCNPTIAVAIPCESGDDIKDYPPDIEVTKSCDDQVLVGGTIACEVHVENIGLGPALSVSFMDGEVPAPASLNFDAGSLVVLPANPGLVLIPGMGVVGSLGLMAPGASFDISFTATAAGPAESHNINGAQADVVLGLDDEDLTNNADIAVIHEFLPDINVQKLDVSAGLPGVPANGWTMSVYSGAGCAGSPIASGVTAGSGMKSFDDLAAGTYCVKETLLDPATWGRKDCATGADLTDLTQDIVIDGTAKDFSMKFCNALLVANEAWDMGVTTAPPGGITLAVGDSATIKVTEPIWVTDPGVTPVLVHIWDATTGGGVANVDWKQATVAVNAPASVKSASDPNGDTPTQNDILNSATQGHTLAATYYVSADLTVKCVDSGEETLALSLNFLAAKVHNVPSQLSIPVRCLSDVAMVKDPAIHNLWICQGSGCDPASGEGSIVIDENAFNVSGDPEGVGAFEFQVKFDHKIFDIVVDATSWLYENGRVPGPLGIGGCAMTIENENSILFGCVSKDNPGTPGNDEGATSNGTIATLTITPDSDMVNRLTPGQENGVVRTILDENCEFADIYGDPLSSGAVDLLGRPIPLPGVNPGGDLAICEDVTLTVRILEGDLNVDCIVDVLDDQAIAYRYGAFFGNLLYDPWYDLQPALKDFDIDIKDLQKVFGRNGSTCEVPIPPQDPLGPPPY